jgi:DNA-binding GntR family transcriptional regulator
LAETKRGRLALRQSSADQQFHDILRSKCPGPFLQSLIDTIQVPRERIRMLELRERPESHQAGYREHVQILAALQRRDGKQARTLMQAHLDRLCEEVSQFAGVGHEPPEPPGAPRVTPGRRRRTGTTGV